MCLVYIQYALHNAPRMVEPFLSLCTATAKLAVSQSVELRKKRCFCSSSTFKMILPHTSYVTGSSKQSRFSYLIPSADYYELLEPEVTTWHLAIRKGHYSAMEWLSIYRWSSGSKIYYMCKYATYTSMSHVQGSWWFASNLYYSKSMVSFRQVLSCYIPLPDGFVKETQDVILVVPQFANTKRWQSFRSLCSCAT